MQIICQNAQQENVYLLVPLVNLIGQIKWPVLIKYRNGRNKWELMNIAPKIINKIPKCSGKQHLNVSSIFHAWWTFKLLLIKMIKMADLIPILDKS